MKMRLSQWAAPSPPGVMSLTMMEASWHHLDLILAPAPLWLKGRMDFSVFFQGSEYYLGLFFSFSFLSSVSGPFHLSCLIALLRLQHCLNPNDQSTYHPFTPSHYTFYSPHPFFLFCTCTYSRDTWLVGVVQRNQPVYICSCGVCFIIPF